MKSSKRAILARTKRQRIKLLKEIESNGCWRLEEGMTCGFSPGILCSDCLEAIKILNANI